MAEKIWLKDWKLSEIQGFNLKTCHSLLGVEFSELGLNYLEATMPVDDRTCNPIGILHGGASAVLAETLGSVASMLVVGSEKSCVGIEINATHIKSMKKGTQVVGRAEALRLGRKIHNWRIQIFDSADRSRLVCESRLSVFVK